MNELISRKEYGFPSTKIVSIILTHRFLCKYEFYAVTRRTFTGNVRKCVPEGHKCKCCVVRLLCANMLENVRRSLSILNYVQTFFAGSGLNIGGEKQSATE